MSVAGGIVHREALRAGVTTQTQHQPAYRIRRIAAVVVDLLEAPVTSNGLILDESPDKVRKRLPGQRAGPDRILEGHEDRMACLTGVHGLHFGVTPVEQFQASGSIVYLIRQVIRPTAEGVDVVEILVEVFREQERDYVEIFVVVMGEPTGIGERFLPAPGPGHGLLDEIFRD